ncbi:hypothetical protein BS50DRAFT_628691 [Corynespora cassiicola Philippines]|uniref:Uncharacterized protein n=1 Tax=Corynespora cassiicola Philippines TaxID=1448308 RepID=A0A2T2PCY3_CORCC|nr:hypothetical protein BS50DRAFT_628691 [Corynespora cassiicola Philippines]
MRLSISTILITFFAAHAIAAPALEKRQCDNARGVCNNKGECAAIDGAGSVPDDACLPGGTGNGAPPANAASGAGGNGNRNGNGRGNNRQ